MTEADDEIDRDAPQASAESKTRYAKDRTEFAEERTEYAEDRTLMANERTFAGWIRTGLAAVGIGLGFNALFGKMEPAWLPKAIATCFILVGIFVFYAAQRNGCRVVSRLDSHNAQPIRGMNLRAIAAIMGAASVALIAGLWLMNTQ